MFSEVKFWKRDKASATSSTSNNPILENGSFKDRMESFVIGFVREFEMRLYFYDLILQGEIKKAKKLFPSYTKKVGGYVGGPIGGIVSALLSASEPMSLPNVGSTITSEFKMVSMGEKAGEWSGDKVNARLNDQKRRKYANILWDIIKLHQEDRIGLRKVLVLAALDIFRSFEFQLVKVNNNEKWRQGIIDIAKDGVHRSTNYYVVNYEDANAIHEEMISMGVIYGKSKYKPLYAKPDLIYQDEIGQIKWSSPSLYRNTGVVVEQNGSYLYYEKKDQTNKVGKYGYRRLFRMECKADIEEEYELSQKSNDRFQNYEYKFQIPNDDEMKNILNKIDSNYDNVTQGSLKEIIEEVRDSILKEVNQSIKLRAECTDLEVLKILQQIATNIEKLNMQDLQKNFEEKLNEIKDIDQLTLKEVRTLNTKIDKIEENITVNSSKRSAEHERILFNVQAPVHLFTEREIELNNLHKMMQRDEERNIMSVIWGIGGVGKTQLALRYIEKFGQNNYENIIWIDSESKADLDHSFREIAKDLEIRCCVERETTKFINKIYEKLSKKDTLIIFDNAEKDEYFEDFLPHGNYPDRKKMHILITSQNREWGLNIRDLHLSEFSLNEGIQLVKKGLKITDSSEDENIKKLLKKLQNFPLCIIQAISYIKDRTYETSEYTISNYLREFKEMPRDLLDSELFRDLANDPYKKTAYRTWTITTEKIGKNASDGKLALKIFYTMSYLAPQNIKRKMFLILAKNDQRKVEKAIRLLAKYSLINASESDYETENPEILCYDEKKQGETNFQIHRTVQEVTRLYLKEKKKENEVIGNAFKVLSEFMVLIESNAVDYNKIRETLLHFEAFLKQIKYRVIQNTKKEDMKMYINVLEFLTTNYTYLRNPKVRKNLLEDGVVVIQKYYGPNHNKVAATWTSLAHAYQNLGELQKARESFEKALYIKEKCYGSNHCQVATTLSCLGHAYGSLGNVQKEIELLEKAFKIKEKNHCSRSYQVAVALTNLGVAYQKLGDEEKAKQFLERALNINQERYGPNNYRIARQLTRLGHAHGSLGDVQKAKEVLEKALNINEKHYGPNHYQVAATLTELGHAYVSLGELQKGKELLEKALNINKNHHGPDHYEVAKTLINLSQAYRYLGDIQKAKEGLEKALDINEKHYGPNHYQVAATLSDLGHVYDSLGNVQKKKELLEKALNINEKYYGSDHYKVAVTLRCLGSACGSLGDFQKKKELLEKTLNMQEKHYGLVHYQIAVTLIGLGTAQENLGNVQKAKELLERALSINEKHSDSNNYQAVKILTTLGTAYISLGELEKAKELLEKALNIHEKHYSHDYYPVAIILTKLGIAYKNLGDVQKAKTLLEQAFNISEKHYGSNHYQIVEILTNLGLAYGNFGDVRKKIELLEQALNIQEKHHGPDHYQVAITLTTLSHSYRDMGDILKAKKVSEKAKVVLEKHFGLDHYRTCCALDITGLLYGDLGDIKKKSDFLKKALTIKEKYYGDEHYELCFSLENLGVAYGDLGDNEEKIKLLQKALSIKEKHYGLNHYQLGFTLENLGVAYGDLGNIDKEIQFLQQALSIKEKHYGCNHYQLAFSLENLGIAFGELGDVQKKITLLKQVLSVKEKHYGANHYQLGPTLYNLAVAYDTLGDIKKRDEFLAKAFNYF